MFLGFLMMWQYFTISGADATHADNKKVIVSGTDENVMHTHVSLFCSYYDASTIIGLAGSF